MDISELIEHVFHDVEASLVAIQTGEMETIFVCIFYTGCKILIGLVHESGDVFLVGLGDDFLHFCEDLLTGL